MNRKVESTKKKIFQQKPMIYVWFVIDIEFEYSLSIFPPLSDHCFYIYKDKIEHLHFWQGKGCFLFLNYVTEPNIEKYEL